VILLGTGLDGLARADEMAESLAMLSRGYSEPFDPQDWVFRWRVSASGMFVLGLAALASGVGLIRKCRWGVMALAVLTSMLLLVQATTKALDLEKYAFERTGSLELAITAMIAAGSWFALRLTRRLDSSASPAGTGRSQSPLRPEVGSTDAGSS
jgi:hypothetical protein